MIKYIKDESRKIPRNLNVVVDILFSEQHGITSELSLQSKEMMSKGAAAWSGFSRRDPFVDVPKYPPTSFLSEVRHTFSTIVLMISDVDFKSGREELAKIIEALPDLPA